MTKVIFNKSYSLFIVALLILFYFYHEVILNINSILFSGHGDGIKNYYTYMFHAKYDQDFWNFTGMNYPFNEHIVYTDAHPLLSYLIGKFGLVDYGVGILNSLMLISYPLSSVLMFKILKQYKIEPLWSFFGALVISFMAPQIFRLTGHLSLSYAFSIPLMWYLLIKLTDTKKLIWTIIIGLVLLIFFFTHPYLGLILAVFGLAYALVFVLFNKREWVFYSVRLVLPIVLSIVVFQLLIQVTDSHVDRLKTPAGFFDYYAKWNSLLVSHHGPMNKIKHLFGFRMSGWESWSYIGLSTIAYLLIGIGYYFKNKSSIKLINVFKTPLGKLYLVGHIILLFSFCFPIKYDFLRWIVDVLGPLKQFRVLGRFTWVYFYIVTVVGIYIIATISSKSEKKLKWQIIFYAGILFSIFEIYPVHIGVAKSISSVKNIFQKSNVSKDLNEIIEWTKGKNYDAILFLPFSHLSSESVFILGAEKANADAMTLSYHTNLPLLNTISSRTSLSESILFQNLFSRNFIDKELAYKIGNDKKILLIKNKDGLDINELRMIWNTDQIYKNNSYSIYDFSFDKWNNSNAFDELIVKRNKAKINVNNGWFSDTNYVWYIYESFENLIEHNAMVGKGAFAGQKNGIHILKDDIINLDDGTYQCSFWYNIKVDRVDQMAIIEQSFTDGTAKWVDEYSIRETNLIVGDWAFVEMEFEITKKVEKTKLFLSGNDSKQWFVVDELLIKKANDRPLFKSSNLGDEAYIIFDNFWLKANSFSK